MELEENGGDGGSVDELGIGSNAQRETMSRKEVALVNLFRELNVLRQVWWNNAWHLVDLLGASKHPPYHHVVASYEYLWQVRSDAADPTFGYSRPSAPEFW